MRKYSMALLMLAPLLSGMGMQHSYGPENLATIPVEKPQNNINLFSFSEIVEETSKEDDIHFHNSIYLPQGNKFSGRTVMSGTRTRIVIVVPYPPPDPV
jgi:hypothetical protein